MADRFYSEGSKNNGAAGSDISSGSLRPQNTNPYSRPQAKGLGDFSENIDSNKSSKRAYAQPQRKFEVHINDFDNFVGMPEPPATPKAPSPISQRPDPKKQEPKPMPKKRPTPTELEKTVVYKKTQVPVNKQWLDERKKSAEKKSSNSGKRQLTPEMQEKIKAKKRYNFIKTALITCVCIFFISIMTVSASTIAMQFINDVLVIDKQGGSVNVTVPEGAGFDEVFNILEQQGLIKQRFLCHTLLKIRDYDTVEYQPGVYYLDKDAGIEINMESMMVQNNGNKGTVRLTFPEGWTIAQIFEKIEKYEVCSADKLYANLDLVGNQFGFIEDIKTSNDRYLKCEGYLFPDTYDFFIDENPASVLKKLFNNFNNKWTADYAARAKELGLTVDEVINIAAMIQREAKDSSQMSTISSIIHNRLSAASTYPMLDMNSTKDYIVSLESFDLFSDFYYELYLNSYNTYSVEGLPPGPICNPGATAIKAALYPADTDYYFFMHSPTGEMYVAKTASEHNKNTQMYLYD